MQMFTAHGKGGTFRPHEPRCAHIPVYHRSEIPMTTPAELATTGSPAKHALVIGIDKYDEPWELGGCVNDARLMAAILEEKFGFANDDVRLLIDEAATKDGILDAFDDLIDAATGQ